MRIYRIPLFIKLLYPDCLVKIKVEEKVLFLSFDDGPIPEITPWVIKELKKYHAKATFFCVGDNVVKYPEIKQALIKEGHQLGNHTFYHSKGWLTKTKLYQEDVEKCAKHVESKLFRPPYGQITLRQFRVLRKDYRIVLWDLVSYDFDSDYSPKNCLKMLEKKARPGSIIVFHDSIKAKENLMEVLPPFLDHFSKLGYLFETIPNIMKNDFNFKV